MVLIPVGVLFSIPSSELGTVLLRRQLWTFLQLAVSLYNHKFKIVFTVECWEVNLPQCKWG